MLKFELTLSFIRRIISSYLILFDLDHGHQILMKVHHIVPRIHAEASGTTYVVPRLCSYLAKAGVDTELHVIRKNEDTNYDFKVNVYRQLPMLDRLGLSPEMKRVLKEISTSPCIMHNHSLWMMPNVYPGVAAKNANCRLIVSPHGTLSDWALKHSKLKKQLIWWLGQKNTLERACCFHATAESEYKEIRNLGFKQPIAIIPNGVDLPKKYPKPKNPAQKQLLFLGRLHPKKGVDLLLEAWSALEKDYPDWHLQIIGPENFLGYLNKLEKIIQHHKLLRAKLYSPIYGEEKTKTFAEASLFILPSFSENFGITVAEALYQETPVIVSKGAPWAGIEENNCGWWIDLNKQQLTTALKQAFDMPLDELNEMGKRGHRWITNNFAWESVALKMKKTYQWILNKTEKPDWVINE